jgi:hypothetical protein
MVFLDMMVPEDKEEGLIQAGYDKIKIIHGQIPRRKDQIDILEPLLDRVGIYQGIYLI